MAIQNRLIGWALTSAAVGNTVNLLEYFKDIEIDFNATLMEARTPHDSVVNGGAHFPRPKSRRLEITVSGVIPGENLDGTGPPILAPDNLFDEAYVDNNLDMAFSFVTPSLSISGVGIATSGDIDFGGDEGMQSIKIIARSYSGNVLVDGITQPIHPD